jgi:hypothetical protein
VTLLFAALAVVLLAYIGGAVWIAVETFLQDREDRRK